MNASVEVYLYGVKIKTATFGSIADAKLYADKQRDWFGYWTLLIY